MQAQIHHSVDAMDFVIEAEERISLISVLCILRGASKVPLFAHLGPLVGHLPKDPLHDFGFLMRFPRQKLPALLGQVYHDGA